MDEGVSVIQWIFRVHAAGLSRDVVANQRNVAALRRYEDIGFTGGHVASRDGGMIVAGGCCCIYRRGIERMMMRVRSGAAGEGG